MPRRSLAAAALLIAAAGGALPSTASAAFPGRNGAIAYSLSKYDKRAKAYGFLGQGALFTVNADGSGGVALPDDANSNDGAPAWSADGTQLAYSAITNGKRSGICVGPVGSPSKRLLVKSSTADMPAFSPDGKTIVFSDYGKGIFSVPADGSAAPTLLVRSPKGWLNLDPTFAPNGSTVFFSRYKATDNPKKFRSEIWAIDPTGTNPRVVIAQDSNHLYPDSPDVSPDGSKLVFAASTSEGAPAIWTSAIDGSATNVLAVAAGSNYLGSPAWSPDGTKLAAVTLKPSLKKGSALVTLDAATGAQKSVRSVTKAYVSSPSWQPIPATTPAG